MMGSGMLDQARLDWVTKNLKLAHYIYEMASGGDATALSLRDSIHERAHLTKNQIHFARSHVRASRPAADLDESSAVINEATA